MEYFELLGNFIKSKMRIETFISTILLIFSFSNSIGQTNCQKEKITGEWTYINSFPYYEFNIDSLVKVSTNSRKSIGKWAFKNGGTYVITTDSIIKRNSKGHYKVFEDKCEIRLGKKKKTPEGLIFSVMFLDDNYLILKCSKPKGDFVYVTKRL
jgi:hypothetical protein